MKRPAEIHPATEADWPELENVAQVPRLLSSPVRVPDCQTALPCNSVTLPQIPPPSQQPRGRADSHGFNNLIFSAQYCIYPGSPEPQIPMPADSGQESSADKSRENSAPVIAGSSLLDVPSVDTAPPRPPNVSHVWVSPKLFRPPT